MKGIPFLIFLMILATMISGCFETSDEDEDIEFIDDSGNTIVKEGGERYFIGKDGERIKLDGKVSSINPDQVNYGIVNTLTIDGSGTGALVLPNFTFPVMDGMIQNETIVVFAAGDDISIMIAPFLNESSQRDVLEITVYGKERTVYSFPIAEPADPIVSGQYWYDLEDQVTDDLNGYNGRYVGEGSPQLERAALFFRDLFESFGIEAHIERYPVQGQDVQVVNVVAYHWGENRDDWIVYGAHYDVAPLATWEGAYDNTAGTCAVVSVAKGFSQFETNKTMVFGLWSSEEQGLHGSDEFVKNLPPDVTVNANINLDMIGLAYPSPGKRLSGMVFPDENASAVDHPHFVWYMNHTIYDVLGLTRDTDIFSVREGGGGGSDHTPFRREGIPAVFYHSGPVSNYHTMGDTLDNMIVDAGSVELLIGGFDTALWICFLTAFFLDGDGYVHPP